MIWKRSKTQGRKEEYTQLNAEFQRIARRDKKILSEQCKEIEENITMGKTSNLFMKIAYFHAKMGTIKDRINKDLTEAEEIKKKWQEYTENYMKKVLMTQIIMMVCLEPDILEYALK